MRRFEHGGDIYSHEGVVDFSANLNPLGMPPAVQAALRENIAAYETYPDPNCTALTAAIAKAQGVGFDQVICTAGATDLMTRAVRASGARTALVTAPCYSGYEQALEQGGTRVVRHTLREADGFEVTDALLECLNPAPSLDSSACIDEGDGIDLVFIANPNNPTGLTVDADLLERILMRAGEMGARVVLDECFIEFTEASSMLARIDEFPQLVVMRAFTKTYSMAGLRLGYGACSDVSFVQRMHEFGQPWAVSTPAQIAGCAALEDPGFVGKSRSYVASEREKLKEALESLGLRVLDGKANYLMFACQKELYQALLERGFLIRRCENFEGLDSSWYRVAVRAHEQNAQLVDTIREVLR